MIDVLLANGFEEIVLSARACYGRHGVYVLFDRRGDVIYVGQGNVRCRVQHHNYRRSRTKWNRAVALYMDRGRLALEAELIRLLKPRFNRSPGAFRRRNDHPVVAALAQPSLPIAEAA